MYVRPVEVRIFSGCSTRHQERFSIVLAETGTTSVYHHTTKVNLSNGEDTWADTA